MPLSGPDVRDLNASLKELYGSLDNSLNMLAAIGIRTAFDIATELLKIDQEQTFARKLDDLVINGHIGAVDRSRLETLIDAGSASAHRGWRPNFGDLDTMMDVLEHFIEHAFVTPERKKELDAKVTEMKGQVPPRGSGGKRVNGVAHKRVPQSPDDADVNQTPAKR
jgi:hypothetical protein